MQASVGGKLDQIMVEKQPRIIQGGDACFEVVHQPAQTTYAQLLTA